MRVALSAAPIVLAAVALLSACSSMDDLFSDDSGSTAVAISTNGPPSAPPVNKELEFCKGFANSTVLEQVRLGVNVDAQRRAGETSFDDCMSRAGHWLD